ncbi:2-succinyl-6-hydroxy-2,4-cyclohexadiene-1-carboxylate synthase [Arenibacter antarcticus]|uniref:Alpha/beta hydrolase n=1 Tax=Arenibacter antarcticus TaxID=2040469 RepID=A0ABW5VJC6_9FLAO|nr:alpha/beta hydrolase family protein [Arenibacter sp. H213]MCM4166152.1 XynC protein [Arenibacter sp. H213]
MKLKLLFLFLTVNTIIVNASQVDTVMVVSKSMNKSIPNMVITPDNYSTQKESYPVVYLLHGAGGNYADWVSKVPELKEYVDTYNIIIVCPDGGLTSWYFDSPIDEKMKYETYISKELISTIDKEYNTTATKSGRAITGLSMGGHGAFYLAFKHQDIWGAAGSMSGGLDIRPFPNNWDLKKRLGEYADHKENWEENTVINMVYKLTENSLKIVFDCGIGDFFYDANKRLHEKLVERNIAHDYTERPGKHNWNYWTNSIKYQLLFFNDYFKL